MLLFVTDLPLFLLSSSPLLEHVGYFPFTCPISCISYNNWGYKWIGQAISYSGRIMRCLVGIYGDVSRALHPVLVFSKNQPVGYVHNYLLDSHCLLLHTLCITKL